MKTRLAKVTQFAILSLLLIGIGIASTSTAAAQRRNRWDGYPNWGGSYQLRETALNAGYNEGVKEGRNDRARNRYRNYSDFSAYNDATHDYSSRSGDRDLYRRYYRLAFERGYDTENPNNYNNRNDRNDRNGQDNRDRNRDRDNNNNRRGRRRNYNDISEFRNATADYSSRLGDRELYRRYYREGFENGYADGYQGY